MKGILLKKNSQLVSCAVNNGLYRLANTGEALRFRLHYLITKWRRLDLDETKAACETNGDKVNAVREQYPMLSGLQ